VLERGFALVRDEAGHALRSAATVARGARLDLEFADGRVAAVAGATAAPGEPPKRPSRAATKRPARPSEQGDLF